MDEGLIHTARATMAAVPSTFPRKALTAPQALAVIDAWMRSRPGFDGVAYESTTTLYLFEGAARFRVTARTFKESGSAPRPTIDAALGFVQWASRALGDESSEMAAGSWERTREMGREEGVPERFRREAKRRADILHEQEMVPHYLELIAGKKPPSFNAWASARRKEILDELLALGSIGALPPATPTPERPRITQPFTYGPIRLTPRTDGMAGTMTWTIGPNTLTLQHGKKPRLVKARLASPLQVEVADRIARAFG